ncbi:baseplate multidomain protein megatron [Polycladidibacter stylochi]|uniref:baseplate multidomain protein megatron n=1 Tax=Polycladidibacter stylochi TaxID=1807766 RepID=UPI000A99D7EE|nr:glycoside hydrolase TIM-barrel-like domain-containing protein [Pseudovibrio stylochi]
MATMVLSGIGAAVGGAIGGPFGMIAGQALGAIGGSLIDQALFATTKRTHVGQIGNVNLQTSTEGRPLTYLYGTMRLQGEIIWATRYEETIETEEQGGGKAAQPSAEISHHRYYANVALAICVGPVNHLRRIWANGRELDLTTINYRFYKGDKHQLPDPLIKAKQGETPAYRGICYIVFERLPLHAYGNRIPQFAFEVMRAVEPLEKQIQAITLIPGSGEFVYETAQVLQKTGLATSKLLNRHQWAQQTDVLSSLEELLALCPNLRQVALVSCWFGDDLRAGNCRITPRVAHHEAQTTPHQWQVDARQRRQVPVVSRVNGRPAFGGTPSDSALVSIMKWLKQRGVEVVLYPFLMMDIKDDNTLPNPDAQGNQPPYPWRGRITLANKSHAGTAQATNEIAAFMGTKNDHGYRRFILHHAQLARLGGAKALLIGSEMRTLTRTRASKEQPQGDLYPFVNALKDLLRQAREIVGPSSQTKLSYAADWSEYAAHQPEAGTLQFPLDPLWADENLDFIAIDNYLPLSDIRDDAGAFAAYHIPTLKSQICGGEYYDWYYANDKAREQKERLPITDGDYGEPWLYQAKAIVKYFSNHHFPRHKGIRQQTPTAYKPLSKPLWFTELGCPAVDRGANQPNVFYDPKSSESRLPHFSRGIQDDLAQRRYLQAMLEYWHEKQGTLENPEWRAGEALIAPKNMFIWTWDARPFPAFPNLQDVWADGDNWRQGHWLNGRLGTVSLPGLLTAIAADFDIPSNIFTTEETLGTIAGFTVSGLSSFQEAVEPLLPLFDAGLYDRGPVLKLQNTSMPISSSTKGEPFLKLSLKNDLILANSRPQIEFFYEEHSRLPKKVQLVTADPLNDYESNAFSTGIVSGDKADIIVSSLPAAMGAQQASLCTQLMLHQLWQKRQGLKFVTDNKKLDIVSGRFLEIETAQNGDLSQSTRWCVEQINRSDKLEVSAVKASDPLLRVNRQLQPSFGAPKQRHNSLPSAGTPWVELLELPRFRNQERDEGQPHIAATMTPWPGAVAIYKGEGDSHAMSLKPLMQIKQPATMGRTRSVLSQALQDRINPHQMLDVELAHGQLLSRSQNEVFAGANAIAVKNGGPIESDQWEVIQFFKAELIAKNSYRLSKLLRGQLGTPPKPIEKGMPVVLLDHAVHSIPFKIEQIGYEHHYQAVAQGHPLLPINVARLTVLSKGRSLRPYAPVHARLRHFNDGLKISFIPRTRWNGDNWHLYEVPLNETLEKYLIKIIGDSGDILREEIIYKPEYYYSRENIIADFKEIPKYIPFVMAQISTVVGTGDFLSERLYVPPSFFM